MYPYSASPIPSCSNPGALARSRPLFLRPGPSHVFQSSALSGVVLSRPTRKDRRQLKRMFHTAFKPQKADMSVPKRLGEARRGDATPMLPRRLRRASLHNATCSLPPRNAAGGIVSRPSQPGAGQTFCLVRGRNRHISPPMLSIRMGWDRHCLGNGLMPMIRSRY